ncbi:MAG: putative peptidase [Chlamydiia bacterium]|nr:putative peptidase [Chlamydiia bacterium]MCH9616281.1 putative peptidase [Chlamydiia bacterium]MCH9629733.1 putative peptidase [Chlamydiia bacterium]
MRNSLLKERLKNFQALLKDDAYYIADPQDLYYLTGLRLSRGELLIKKRSARLSVDGRYQEMASKLEHMTVKPIAWKGESVGVDGELLSYAQFLQLKKAGAKPKNRPNPVRGLRAQKDKSEIAKIKKSATLAVKAYQYAKSLLKEGVEEIQIAKAIIQYAHKHGEGPSFDPIVAFGKNTSMPHYHPGNVKLKKNQMVLLDLGVILDDYCSDITRTFAFGNVTKEMVELRTLVQKAQDRAISLVKPGESLKSLEEEVRKIFGEKEKFFIHSLGHGIGLDVHESPRREPFKENMIITIEPGLYLPNIGGIRLEEMVLITKNGGERLT